MPDVNRKAFSFYYSHWEQIKLLNTKQQLELFKAICKVQFLEININDVEFKNHTLNLVWTGIKHSIDASIKGYVSKLQSVGVKVHEPLAMGRIDPPKSPCPQEKEEGEEEEKEQYKGLKYSELKKETWDKWINYKKSQFKFVYKTLDTEQTALSALISLSRNNDNTALKIVNQSISNGWKGLFELKNNGQHKEKQVYTPPPGKEL